MTRAQRKPPPVGHRRGLSDNELAAPAQDTPPLCISCKGPGPLRTPTGHHACLDCLLWWNHPMVWLLWNDHPELDAATEPVTDVTDVTDVGGKL